MIVHCASDSMLVAINAIPPSTASSSKALWKVFFYSAKDSKLAVESNQWFVCVCVLEGKRPQVSREEYLVLANSRMQLFHAGSLGFG